MLNNLVMAGAMQYKVDLNMQIYHHDHSIWKHQVNLTLTVPLLLCKGGMMDIVKDQLQEGRIK